MISRGRLLVDDAYPWDDTPADRWGQVHEAFAPLGFEVLDAASLSKLLRPVVERTVRRGDVVVLPMMSGALLAADVERVCAERGARLLALHTSKHPFVTLSGDDPAAAEATLDLYEREALTMDDTVRRVLTEAPGERVRVVFVDSNSARGRDALVVRRWLQERSSRSVDLTFLVAVNETTESPAEAPGWRAGLKDLAPDAWGVRLVGSTTAYLSHLRFLVRAEEQQFAGARAVRFRHPGLTRFWDSLPAHLAAVHGHRVSELAIHRERTHARLSPQDAHRAADIADALARLDRRAPARSTPGSVARRRHLLRLGRP